MKRVPLLAATLALALPTAGSGESINLQSSGFVERVAETLRDPLVSSGFETRAADVDVYFGARPKVGKVMMDDDHDFVASSGDALARLTGLPFGERGRIGALVRFDTAGASAETRARATVTVTRGYRAGGPETDAPLLGADTGMSRMLADLCGIDPRHRHIPEDAHRVDLPLQAKF